MDLVFLRWIFLAACAACVGVVAWRGRWEGRLIQGDGIWIVELDRAPIWAPPGVPPYSVFKEDFGDSVPRHGAPGFPRQGASGLMIHRVLKLDWMAADLLLYLWVVTIGSGLLYLALRGGRRDLLLHVALWAGIGLTIGAAASVALWAVFGGWGPPVPGAFAGAGLVAGVVVGLVRFKARTA